jgi:hypothetical protein
VWKEAVYSKFRVIPVIGMGGTRTSAKCDMIYLLNCIWVATRWQYYGTHLHTSNTQINTKQTMHRSTQNVLEECGPCPVFASYTLAFALQLREKHGKPSVRVAEECQLVR